MIIFVRLSHHLSMNIKSNGSKSSQIYPFCYEFSETDMILLSSCKIQGRITFHKLNHHWLPGFPNDNEDVHGMLRRSSGSIDGSHLPYNGNQQCHHRSHWLKCVFLSMSKSPQVIVTSLTTAIGNAITSLTSHYPPWMKNWLCLCFTNAYIV